MKKLSFLVFVTALFAVTGANAQKQVIQKFQESQARLLEVNTNAYVRPQVVDFEIMTTAELTAKNAKIDATDGREYTVTGSQGRLVSRYLLTADKVIELKEDLANIRAWGVFQITKDFEADVLVGGVSDFKTSDDMPGLYELTIIGFPARFTGWNAITPEDYQWINIENLGRRTDAEKTKTLVK